MRWNRVHWNTHLDLHAHARPDAPALRFDGATTTWAQLRARVNALADGLARRGVGRGDRVAVIMGNRPEFLETVLATNRLGAIAVPVNFRLTAPEADYILADSGAVLVVVDDLGAPVVGGVAGTDLPVIAHDYEDVLAEPGDPHEPTDVREDDPALIMYTSGTTGRPKGAVLTHLNLQHQALTIIRAWQFGGPEEVNLVASPLFHIGALGSVIPTLLAGATLVIVPTGAFDSTAMLDTVEREGVTTLFLVPTQWDAVCADPTVAARDLSRLRVTCWGAAPATDVLLRRMAETFPGAINVAVFGQTEMSPVTCVLEGRDAIRKLGSVGRPIPTVAVRVVDPDMKDVGTDQVGEIVYRGPGTMLGYWNNAEATEEAFRGGWFHSGDLVRVDAEGYVYVVDRAKDMIISGGENIYCAEVENVLAEHPAVAEVSIVGEPHPKWGETPVAYVVLHDPDARLDIGELRDWAAASLARYKLPTRLEILNALPRNASGKVVKAQLRVTPRAGV